jgi:hypothetical protein
MKRGAPLLLFLVSCGGSASRVEEVPPELRTPVAAVPPASDRWPWPIDPALKPGDWARYREAGQLVTLAVVGREGDALWIESILEGEPRQASALLVGPDRSVRKAWYGEVSKEGKSALAAQPIVQAAHEAEARSEAGAERGERTVRVGGRELRCVSSRLRVEDLDGRLREELWLRHADVPPLRGPHPSGGLVLWSTGTRTIELVDFGRDARPLLDRP